jgi:hypothetical protein
MSYVGLFVEADQWPLRVLLSPPSLHCCPSARFRELRPNDIVFIDSNHVVRSGSEVNFIVLEILPILPKGVLVQFHDIYLPYDYDRELLENFIHPNETALVAAFLACNTRYRILFPLSMLHYERRHEMQRCASRIQPGIGLARHARWRVGTKQNISHLRYGCALRGRVRCLRSGLFIGPSLREKDCRRDLQVGGSRLDQYRYKRSPPSSCPPDDRHS